MNRVHEYLEGCTIKGIFTDTTEDNYELLLLFTNDKSLRIKVEWEEAESINIATNYNKDYRNLDK